MPLPFAKIHGLGNDFVLIDGIATPLPDDLSDLARRMCDRHRGIGADGLILLLPSTSADVRMRMFNPDGSEPEMCGNGIRCLAAFARERRHVENASFTVETGAGVLRPALSGGQVTVDMGEPRLLPGDLALHALPQAPSALQHTLEHGGHPYRYTGVSMGNPHCIIFLDEQRGTPLENLALADVPLADLGAALCQHPAFPQQTNVEFATVSGPDEVAVRVWERGAGATLACGTGACATMVAAHLTGRVGPRARVHLPGGPLEVAWEPGGHVMMTGPYEHVFDGMWRGD